ncbi:MAG: Kelch motif [Acidobacteriaceae bacterium]|nr:Kelch motif [Acidobacteriaceae bacterium]
MKRAPRLLWIIPALLLSAAFLKATLPQTTIGTWTSAASLSQSRSNASAVMLSDGRILVIGGDGGSGPLQSAEFFATNGTVASAAAMNVARSRQFAVVLNDDRVLVGGGVSTGGGTTNSAEIYDASADSWTKTSAMAEARANATAALLADGRVLIAGGDNSGNSTDTIEIFDPSTGNFSFAGTLSASRTKHAMATLQDGRVLIVGGSDGTNPLASTDIFDPSSGTISAGPSLARARYSHSATTLLNGQVAVIGGSGSDGNGGTTDLASVEIFDPSTGAFTPATATLTTAREAHQAYLLPKNNSVLIVGGTSDGTVLASSELFTSQASPSGGAWTYAVAASGSNVTPRNATTGSAMQQDGLLLTAGGSDASGNALASTELYAFPIVKTDQADYPPGTTVNITGGGFKPRESVTITLVESPLIDTHGPYTITADANGNISDSSFVTDTHDENVRFWLSAVGSQSGLVAQNTFTDSVQFSGVSVGSQAPAAVLPGTSATFPISLSTSGNGSTGCTVTLTITGGLPPGAASLFSPNPLTNNTGNQSTLTVTPNSTTTAGNYTFTVQATAPAVSGGQGCSGGTFTATGTLHVAGTATHLSVAGFTSSATSGTPGTFSVTALDSNNNSAIGYTGTVSFTSSDAQATFSPTSYAFVGADNGTHTFTNGATLKTAGTQSITATDTAHSTFTGSQTGITVNAATANSIAATAGTPQSAPVGAAFGTPLQAPVKDAFNNPVANATVTFTAPTSGASGKFANNTNTTTATTNSSGVATASAFTANTTTGSYTVTASTSGVATPASFSLTNTAGPATKFVVSAPASATAGTPISVTVTAQDSNGNTAAGYTGTVKFTLGTTDASATLPTNYTFVSGDAGVHSFTNGFTLAKAGSQTVIATDTATATITGTSGNITVGGGTPSKLVFGQPSSNAFAGSQISPPVTVLIQDQFGNATNSTANVTIAIGTNPSSGTLGGTTTVAAAGGTATFSTLSINNAGIGYTFSASSIGLTGATSSSFNIESNLAFTSAVVTEIASACSPQVTLQRQNSGGSAASLPISETVSLSANIASTTFYSDASCATALTGGSLTIAANQSSASFFFKNTSATAPPFNILLTGGKTTDTLVTTTAQSESVVPNIAFMNGPSASTVGLCSATAAKIVAVDGSGTIIAPSAAILVNLATSSANGAFYSDPGCVTAITSIQISPGNKSGAMPFYKDNSAGTPTLTATAGPASDTFQASITKATAVFANLSAPTINFGSTPTTFSGAVNKSGTVVATGTVMVTLAGTTGPISQTATLGANGNFSASLATGTIPTGTYTIQYSYPGDKNFSAPTPNPNVSNSLTINAAATTTSISAPTVTFPANGSVTVTVSSTGLTPTGNVSLTVDGGNPISQALSNGAAVFSLTSPAAGTHNVSASYSAQGNFAASSTTGALHVDYSAPTLTSINPTSGNLNSTLNVVLTGGGFFSGATTVTFGSDITVNSVIVGSQTQLTANITIPSTAAIGLHGVSATNPTPGGGTATLSNAFNVLNPTTTTTVTSSLNPSTFGQPVTFTATVTSQAGTPTGNVIFYDGACGVNALSGPLPLNASGAAGFSTSALNGGNHTISACFAHSGIFLDSSGSVSQQVNQAIPTVTFRGAPASAEFGSQFSVSATTNASTTPTITASGACTISGTTVTMTSGVGICSLLASWAADTNYVSATAMQSSNALPATVSVTIADTTVTYDGTPKSVTPTVTPAVAFAVTYTGISPAVYATSSSAPTEPGSYTVTATVTDPNYAGTISGTLTISKKDPALSLALLTGMPEPSAYGTRVYFELTTGNSPCPTGQVQFFVDGDSTPSSTVTLSNSPCTKQPIEFSTATLIPGTHSVDAVYIGDAYYLGETSGSVSHQVVASATTVTLATSAMQVFVGDSVTLTATVTPSNNVDGSAAAPSGTVQFFEGTTLLGGNPLSSNTATFTISSLAAGSHSITATYVSADGDFSSSSSPVSLETVDKITPTITWANPPDIVYGTRLSATQLNATATDQHNGGTAVNGTFVYNPPIDTVPIVGTRNLTVTFTPDDTATYGNQTSSATIKVTPATLTLTADDASRPYGVDNPTFTFQYGGFVNGDISAVVTTAPTCSTEATPSSNVGTYPVTCSGGLSANYIFKYVDGKLTVNPVTLTASVVGDPTKTYDGTTIATLTLGNFSLSGVVGGDSIVVTKTTGTYNSPDVVSANAVIVTLGINDFTPGTGTLLTNYTLPTSASGTGHITKANANVIITPYNVIYDGSAHTATGSAKGVQGESLAGLNLSGTTHTNAGDFSTDPWTFTDVTGNYNDKSGTAQDHVDKADATIVVTGYSVTYSGAAHTAMGTATGVLGESLSALDLSGTTHTNAGDYLTDPWTFIDVTGNYKNKSGTTQDHIDKADATIMVAGYGVTYNGTAHTATGTAKGVLGESLSGLDLSGTTHTNAGDYLIDPWTFTDSTQNYNNKSGSTHDHIEKADANIVVTGYSVTYNGAAHMATATSKGVLGENLSGLDLSGTTHASAGDYPTDPWAFTDVTGNYNNASSTVHNHIDKADVTIAVAGYSLIYNGTAHTATGTATGVAGVDLSASLNLTGTTHTNAGDYPTDPWTFTDVTGNYNNKTGTTNDHIDKASATIIVTPYSIIYDGYAHIATGTAKGVLNESLSGLDLSGATHTSAGDYPTDPWAFTDVTGNYNNKTGTTNDHIDKATPMVWWANPANTIYGTALSGTQLNASVTGVSGSALPGTAMYTPSAGTVLNAGGGQTLSVSFVPTDTTNYNNASRSVLLNVLKATPTMNWANPANLTYGTALSGAQLNATFTWVVNGTTATVPGTATYTPPSGTVLNPGTQTLSANFVPTDAANYNSATGTVAIIVTYGACSSAVGSGGVILPPINSDGTSVYKRQGGSTIPVKFRVCSASGASISNPSAVFAGTGGALTMLSAVRGTIDNVNEVVGTDIPDAAFRWDASGQQWMFNMATANLTSGSTYTFRINLAFGNITFVIGVK